MDNSKTKAREEDFGTQAQARRWSGVVAAVLLAFAVYQGSDKNLGNDGVFPRIQRFVHLLAFSTVTGMQVWTSFVGGIVLFRNLPRRTFALTQSVLFPVYFNMGFMLSMVVLASFLISHHYTSWTWTILFQVGALSTSCLCQAINNFITTPTAAKVSRQMRDIEDATPTEEGSQDLPEAVKTNPEYKQVRRRFAMLHGVSSILNLSSLISNVLHLYYLANGLTI